MNIAFDLHNTLVDLWSAYKRVFTALRLPIQKAVDWSQSNYPESVRQALSGMYKNPDVMCNLKPFPYVREYLDFLKLNNHKLLVVSAAHECIKETTIKMVRDLFDVDCIVSGYGGNKLKILQDNNINWYIDDCPNELLSIQNADIGVIMISNENTLYNHHLRTLVPWIRGISEALGIKYNCE